MGLASQLFSKDKTVRSNTIEDLNEYNSHSLSTQAKKEEQLATMITLTQKAFDLLGGHIVELLTENETLKKRIRSYDDKFLEKSETKMIHFIDDGKKQP